MRRTKRLCWLPLAVCAALALRVGLAQDNPGICYTGIDPYYAMVNVPSMTHVTNAPDVAVIRSNIISYLWKAKGWPATNMPASFATVPTPSWVGAIGSTNVGRVDRLDIAMDYSMHSIAYHIHAARSCNRLLLYHNGHDISFANDDDNMVRTARLFLNEGHDVMIFCLPLCGENSTNAFNVPGYGPLEVSFDTGGSLDGHNRMGISLENAQGSFIRFFLEPVVVALNYVRAYYSYRDINMVGISGGGWATHMCAAIDPRISYSFPTAGSLPLYLRVGECSAGYSDAEQIWAPLYESTASWLDVYVLGAFGEGRQQVHILNQYDSCCFSGVQYKTYEPFVTNLVASLGAGDYRVYMDMGQTSHTISDSVLTNVISPAINSKLLIPAPQFPKPFASSITTTSAVLVAQLTGVAADVSVYWDTSDKGANPQAWAHTCAYPSVAAGTTLSNLVTALVPDGTNFFRFYATNTTYGTWAWSDACQFRTAHWPLQPTNFSYGMKITFKGLTGGEGLTNFPVALALSSNLNGSGFTYGGFASPSGGDLRFAAADGLTPLNFEIDRWDTNAVSYVWVQVPNLSGTNHCIWAYWGNSAQPNLPEYALDGSTWAGFAGVWHLEEDRADAGTAGLYADSCPGGHAGDDMVSATGKQGVVAGGQQFNGSSDYIPIRDFELPSVFTFSAWVKATNTGTDFYQILARGSDTLGVYLCLHASELAVGGNDGSGWNWRPISGNIADGAWHCAACVYDQNASTVTAYVDGQWSITTNLYFDGNVYFPKRTTLGKNQSIDIQFFPGSIDEVQISSLARSASWIRNAWSNTASNSAFCDYGPVQSSPGAARSPLSIAPASDSTGSTLSFGVAPSWTYRLQYRNSLETGTWQFLDGLSLTSAVFGAGSLTDTNQSHQRFYRLSAEPR